MLEPVLDLWFLSARILDEVPVDVFRSVRKSLAAAGFLEES